MNADQITEIRRRVMALVRQARAGVAELSTEVNSIWSNTARLTPEARRTDAALALAEGRVRIEGTLEEARGVLNAGLAEADRALGRLRDVAPEELAARAAVLSPVLSGALNRWELLINTYRERHRDKADRLLLEDGAEVLIAALGPEGGAFREEWARVQQEAALSRSPEELEALSRREELEGLASYLENAESVVRADLTLMDPQVSGEDRSSTQVVRAIAEARVNSYETENAQAMA